MTTAVLHELDALERLAESHGLRAWRLAVSLMGNASDADDVMQQAYITVARKIDDLPEDDPWPWFCTVVVNIARNARRVRGRASDRLQPIGDYDPADDSTRTPVEVLELAEMADRLKEELAILPEAEREALVLTHLNGMSHSLAAATLRIPVGTLKTNIRRGVSRLRARMGASEKSVACALPIVVFEDPVGGLFSSSRRWLATAHVKSGTTGSGFLARLLPSRTGLAASAISLMLGLGAGMTFNSSESAELARPEKSSETRQLKRSDLREVDATASQNEVMRSAPNLRQRRWEERNQRNQAVVSTPTAEVSDSGELASDVVEVPIEKPSVGDTATEDSRLDGLPGLPVPHPEWEQIEALRKLDWEQLGSVFNEYQAALEAVLSAQRSGQQVSSEMRSRLATAGVEMERQQLRSLARLIDGLPTSLRNGRGEWTHPAVMANLMASRLSQAGLALTDSQIQAMVNQAGRYEAQWLAQQNLNAGQSGVERVLGELELKDEFSRQAQDLLTPEQQAALASDTTRDLAGLDPLSPANMVPLRAGHNDVAAQTPALASLLLMDRVAAELGMARESLNGYEHVFDAWIRDTAPVPGEESGLPGSMSTRELIRAGMAQAAAYQSLQQLSPQNTQLQQAIQNSTTVFVPRIVPPPVVQPWSSSDDTVPSAGDVSGEIGEHDDSSGVPGESSPSDPSDGEPHEVGPDGIPVSNQDEQAPAPDVRAASTVTQPADAVRPQYRDSNVSSELSSDIPSILVEPGETLKPWMHLIQD